MTLASANLVPLNGIHFLIHPMYDAFLSTNPRIVTEDEYEALGGQANGYLYIERSDIESDLRRYPLLVSAYLERAAAIQGREVLLTFLPLERGALRFVDAGFEPHYKRLMTGLQRLLHGRLMVFFGDVDPVNDPKSLRAVREVLEQRGWALPKGLPSYAFGETLDHCVPRAVRHLREDLGLTKFTSVHPYFTDLRFAWPTMTAAERRRLKTALRADQLLVREWGAGKPA